MTDPNEIRLLDQRNRLELEIQRGQEDLRLALEEMKNATRRAVSPARLIRENPAAWIGSAFALGFILGYRR